MSVGHIGPVGIISTAMALALSGNTAAEPAMEEIVVTAQKREQDIQDIPFSITAIGADAVESRDITSIDGISQFVPNLQITPTPGNSTSAQIAIRGGVTINPALTWETTVGLYLDGVYIGKTQGSVFDVIDIERIEVLRGPQGTLYGRNTLAGGINLVTKRPTGEFGGKVRAGLGNYGAQTLAASVDLPEFGSTRISLAGRTEKRDGWVEVGTPLGFPPSSVSELGNVDNRSFRAAVDIDLSEQITVGYRFDHSENDQAASHSQLHRLDFNFGLPLDGFVSTQREEDAAVDGPSFEESEVTGHSLTVDWDINENLAFKSITAKRDLEWNDGLDLDGTPIDVAHTQRLSDYDSFSQELQLVGSYGDVNFVAGLYYFEDDGFTDNPQRFFGAFGPFGLTFVSRYGFETEAFAVYAQADWAMTDTLTLTAGLRYTDEEKDIERELGIPGLPRTIPAGTNASTSFDDVTPTVSLTWAASDSITAFIRYAEGFKSGGFNGEAQTVADTLQPYDSETVRSVEAGIKGTWLDNRLRASVAVFQNEHQDMQLSVFTAQGAAGSSIRNAGEAQIRGFEVEGALALTDDITFSAGFSYLDPEYDEFLDCGGGVDVARNRAFPHAPKNTFNASLDATLLRNDWGNVRFIADYQRIGNHFLYPFPLTPDSNPACAASALAPATEIDSYTVSNARLLVSDVSVSGDAKLEIALWVNNLADEEYRANMIDFGPGFASLTPAYYGLPRTYGVDFQLSF